MAERLVELTGLLDMEPISVRSSHFHRVASDLPLARYAVSLSGVRIKVSLYPT